MTDLELIHNWPFRYCYQENCGHYMRPSITNKMGADILLLVTEVVEVNATTTTMVWMCCERCCISRCERRIQLEHESVENRGLTTVDMSKWIRTILGYCVDEDDEEMAEPLTIEEILALSPDKRAKLVQLRWLVKDLQASGIDPARLRATVAQK